MNAILWDLDGTLVDSEPVHAAAFDAAMQTLGLGVPDDFLERVLGSSDDLIHAILATELGLTLELTEWRALKWDYFRQAATGVRPLDGIADLLVALHGVGVPMAVVSNSTRAEVDLNLAVTGLGRYFATTISRADVASGKPAPEGYLLAASRLQQPPEACVVIEDSVTGARAGLNAGMHTLYHPQTVPAAGLAPQGARLLGPGVNLSQVLAELGFSLAAIAAV